MPLAISGLRMPIWAKPRAAPPPTASPITGRLILPSPTLSGLSEPFWPRPIQLSSTEELLGTQAKHCHPATPEGSARMVYAAAAMGPGGDCGATATPRRTAVCLAGSAAPPDSLLRRLEFAAFSVKSMGHDIRGSRHQWIRAARTPAPGVCACTDAGLDRK